MTFGIHDDSQDVLVVIVGDVKGDKLKQLGKSIHGRPAPLPQLKTIANYDLIKQVSVVYIFQFDSSLQLNIKKLYYFDGLTQ